MLRSDEQFVIKSLASKYSAEWCPGENPPDAYLTSASGRIAVEISSLVELVADGEGNPVPRQSQDEPAIKLADSLNQQFLSVFPGTRAAIVTVFTPVKSYKKLKQQLEIALRKLAEDVDPPTELDIGNSALITVHHEWKPGFKRIAAAVANSNSSTDILVNAKRALADRIGAKAYWSRAKIADESWLALLNIYDILASVDTYRVAYQSLDVRHDFDRILVVSTSGQVDLLFQR